MDRHESNSSGGRHTSARIGFATVLLHTLLLGVAPAQTVEISITVDTESERKPISPLIYGFNAYVYDAEWQTPQDWRVGLENHAPGLNPGSRRLGGNTMTSYNWESGFSNSGNDDNHSNNTFQSFITGAGGAPYAPGAALTTFHGHSLSLGAHSLLQLPAAGYVAADGNGPVSQAEAAPSARWKQVVFDKPGSPASLSLAPDLDDGVVYVDEELNFLIDRFGNAATANGIKAYELDNEPGLWHHYPDGGNAGTHSRLHAERTTGGDVLARSIALAKTVKRIDPDAEVYGPAMWGYPEFYSLWSHYDGGTGTFHQPSDWATFNVEPYRTNNTGDQYRYNRMTWVNAYLDQMRRASEAAGKRLLDVFSVHYYPAFEAVQTDEKRVQAPRSLWDPTFVETSWITQPGNGFTDGRSLELIPKLQRSIDDFYPGTKLAITEYSFGGRHNFSGGIAQADALGIFGKLGVHAAHYFFPVKDFIASAFRIYRNYDEKNSTFGDTSVAATSSHVASMSAYAATAKGGNELHVMVINKGVDRFLNATVSISSPSTWSSYETYSLHSIAPAINYAGPTSVRGNRINFQLSQQAVMLLVFKRAVGSSVDVANDAAAASLNVVPNIVGTDGMLHLELPRRSRATVTLHDALGRTVAELLDGERDRGSSTLRFSAATLEPGRYVARLVVDGRPSVAAFAVAR